MTSAAWAPAAVVTMPPLRRINTDGAAGIVGRLNVRFRLGGNDRLAGAFSDPVAKVIGVALAGDPDVRGQPSISWCAKVMSLRWLRQPTRRTGLPAAHRRQRGFVLRPSRQRPRSGHPPLFPGEGRSLLMRPRDGGIDHQPFQIASRASAARMPSGTPISVRRYCRFPVSKSPIAQADRARPSERPSRAARSETIDFFDPRPRLPLRPPDTTSLSRSHWLSRSTSQSYPDLPNLAAESDSRSLEPSIVSATRLAH